MSLCLHLLVCICECPCIHRCWRASVNILVFTFVGVHMCECPCVYTCMFLCLHLLVCMGECPCIVGVYMPYV